jgi:phosphate starvation-inducible protein PhoH and related proteins
LTEQLKEISLNIQDSSEAIALFGPNDAHIKSIEEALNVHLITRGSSVSVATTEEIAETIEAILSSLLTLIKEGITVSQRDVVSALQLAKKGQLANFLQLYEEELTTSAKGKPIRVKTLGQKRYVKAIKSNDLVFGIGPAGTGKTYLAVVLAVIALKEGSVKRIVLSRPAVEAGESLGFLPGDLQEKVDPYLRPLYDALHDLLGSEQTSRLIERGTIEIAPLAYMRGRTLDDSFVILDEAQNTTVEQMKMFLTRLGFSSKMVITGDETQIDLPKGVKSGLKSASNVLHNVKGISLIHLEKSDVVRHPLVQKIIHAYEGSKESS